MSARLFEALEGGRAIPRGLYCARLVGLSAWSIRETAAGLAWLKASCKIYFAHPSDHIESGQGSLPPLKMKFELTIAGPSQSCSAINLRALTGVAVLAFNLVASAADWPLWRGPDRNGISRETDWSSNWDAAGPAKMWSAKVGIGFASVAVADGRAFTAGWADGKDSVQCLDTATGKLLWSHAYEETLGNKMYEGGPNATPVVVGDHVFAVSKTGRTLCLDAGTGKVRWEVELGKKIGAKVSDWGVSGSPVLADASTLLIAYGPSGVALEVETGRVLWDSGDGKDMTFATPVVAEFRGQRTALFFMSKQLVAVDPKDGRSLWTSGFGQGFRTHCSDPIVVGDRVFISSGDDGGELLKVSDGAAKRVWKNKNLSTFTGTAVLIDGSLYGHETAGYKGADQELRCVDLETGAVKWGEKGFG